MKAAEAATGPTDAPADTADTTVAVRRGRGKSLSKGERIWILPALSLSHSTASNLHRGHCVGGEYLDVSHRKSLSGRKNIDYPYKISNMETVPYHERRTLVATSHAIDIPKTTLWVRRKKVL
jgi:hypothetical protein